MQTRKRMNLFFVALLLSVGGVHATSISEGEQAANAGAVIERLLGKQISSNFIITIDKSMAQPARGPGNSLSDAYAFSATSGTVSITASSGASACAAAYHYLQEACNCLVTWGVNGTGKQLNISLPLPAFPLTVHRSPVAWRYAWNMVTFCYSAVWWNETRWIEEIDWLALHGFNMPLALTGQEFVWMRVFARYNVSLDQLQSWFSGPAFLAWYRAGNIRGFAGPLSLEYITQQAHLQKKILAQARGLGMTPVLPCFSGHVPRVLKEVFPNATITHSTDWNGFPPNLSDVYFIDPTDPLFQTIGSAFAAESAAIFGSNHFYSCDTYNEDNPTNSSLEYLAAASKAVITSIRSQDPQGIWVMQAWLFHFSFWTYETVQAYLSGVDNSSMLILDLNSEMGTLAPQFDQYFGKFWVWNLLHNYGGMRGMYGNLSTVASSPFLNLWQPGSNMVGIGMTPEAIEQNPVMYELLSSTLFSNATIDVDAWVAKYVLRRYSSSAPLASWRTLQEALYSHPHCPRSEMELMPSWESPNFGWQHGSATLTLEAWDQYLQASSSVPNASNNGPYLYDLTDLTRQSVAMFFSDAHRMLVNTLYFEQMNEFTPGFNVTFANLSDLMLSILMKMDAILGANPNYLLGQWTTSAEKLALTSSDRNIFLYNAKNQVTMWGPQAQINDYAAKGWSGLYRDYYHGRWSLFFSLLASTGVDGWNHTTWNNDLLLFEERWNSNATVYPAEAVNSTASIKMSQDMFAFVTMANVSQAFESFANSDVAGSDYDFTPLWTSDVRQLALLCSLVESCKGFNDAGMLKTSTAKISWSGRTLFIKRS